MVCCRQTYMEEGKIRSSSLLSDEVSLAALLGGRVALQHALKVLEEFGDAG